MRRDADGGTEGFELRGGRVVEEENRDGFGVVESPDGSRILLGGFIGVLSDFVAFAEDSEIGGEGGVGVSDTVSVVDTDLVSGGVVINGDEAVESGEPS